MLSDVYDANDNANDNANDTQIDNAKSDILSKNCVF